MVKKEKITVLAKPDDLHFVICCALGYGLGRRTCETGQIPEFITDNLPLLNENGLGNLLANLKQYEHDRLAGWVKDDECDYQHWMKFKASLIAEYEKRGMSLSLHDIELQQWINEARKD